MFTPPQKFVQASRARQAKIKEQQRQRAQQTSSLPISASEPSPSADLVVPSAAPIPIRSGSSSPIPAASPSANSASPSKLYHQGTPPSMSKTLSQISKLEQARKERRARQAKLKTHLAGLDQDEKDFTIFANMLHQVTKKYENAEERRVSISTPRDDQGKILVCVRKRPLNDKEMAYKNFDIITTKTGAYPNSNIYLHEPKIRLDMSKSIDTHKFVFDHVFDEKASNADIYSGVVEGLVDNMFQGGYVTLFAYGQTGSGKTHTIFGSDNDKGVYQSACQNIIERLHADQHPTQPKSILTVQFFEIYSSRVYDLFNNRRRVDLLEDGRGYVQVVGLREIEVDSAEKFIELVEIGRKVRTTGMTEANSTSSRSHAVFQITIYQPENASNQLKMGDRRKYVSADGVENKFRGQFSFVDLAGSERGKETGNISRHARMEGAEINKSLLALKECIRALHRQSLIGPLGSMSNLSSSLGDNDFSFGGETQQKQHIPFRGSKLTQILRDSFMGPKSKTIMIATIGPGSLSAEHTLNTLRYADRVKELEKKGGKRQKSVVVQREEDDGMLFMVDEDRGRSSSYRRNADDEDDLVDSARVSSEGQSEADDERQYEKELADDGESDYDPAVEDEIDPDLDDDDDDDDCVTPEPTSSPRKYHRASPTRKLSPVKQGLGAKLSKGLNSRKESERVLLESHSKSVSKVLGLLNEEEEALRSVLRGWSTLEDYAETVKSLLKKRTEETEELFRLFDKIVQ